MTDVAKNGNSQTMNLSGEQAIFLTPGQIFVNGGQKLRYQACWMVGCARLADEDLERQCGLLDQGFRAGNSPAFESDSLAENPRLRNTLAKIDLEECSRGFLLPLVPKDEVFELLLEKRHQFNLSDDFLERQNWTYETNTSLERLLEKAERNYYNYPLLEQLVGLHTIAPDLQLELRTNYDVEFDRHFYLAPDANDDLLFLRVEDGMFWPEIWRAKFDKQSEVKYRDILASAQKWAKLNEAEVEEVFAEASGEWVGALSGGTKELHKVNVNAAETSIRTGVMPRGSSQHNRTAAQIEEILIVPTVWVNTTNRRVCLSYDFWGEWAEPKVGETKARSGKMALSIGDFQIYHTPEKHQLGIIGRLHKRR